MNLELKILIGRLKKRMGLSFSAWLIVAEFWRKLGIREIDLLDIGGATGMFTAHLNKIPLVRAFNVGLSTWATQNAVEIMKPRTIRGNATHLPLKSEGFDCFVSFDVLEHLSEHNIHLAIGEMHRVVKSEGRGIIIVNSDEFNDFSGDKSHVTKKDSDWWKQQFKNQGFKIQKPIPYPFRQKLAHKSGIAWRMLHYTQTY